MLNNKIKASGLKKDHLAKKLGITYAAFSYKLNGKSPFKVDEALTLAELLDIRELREFKDVFGIR